MTNSHTRRNVFILALCQALAMTAMTITITVTALNGEALLTDKAVGDGAARPAGAGDHADDDSRPPR